MRSLEAFSSKENLRSSLSLNASKAAINDAVRSRRCSRRIWVVWAEAEIFPSNHNCVDANVGKQILFAASIRMLRLNRRITISKSNVLAFASSRE